MPAPHVTPETIWRGHAMAAVDVARLEAEIKRG